MAWTVRRLTHPYEKAFSLDELLAAIEQNGLPQAFSGFWKQPSGVWADTGGAWTKAEFQVEAACAIGVGALNIGANYTDLEQALHRFRNTKNKGLDESIIARNDSHHWSPKKIAQYYRESFRDGLQVRVPVKISYEVIK